MKPGHIRITGARPAGELDRMPPEVSEGIFYVGRIRGHHVLHVYAYVQEEGKPFDLDEWEASRRRVELPKPLCRRTWRIAYGFARRVREWGRDYYKGVAAERLEMAARLEDAMSAHPRATSHNFGG